MMESARRLLRSPTASAVALCRAAEILAPGFVAWEPETLWMELEHQDVDVPAEARDRLMAAVALLLVPSFYWDAVTFASTCVALGGRPAHVRIIEEATPAEMAWAMIEAGWIRDRHGDQSLVAEHEPTAYVAVVLDKAGFALAPVQLAFVQPTLDRRRASVGLRNDVRDRWSSLGKARLDHLELRETPVDVQIARLAAVETHVRARRAAAEAEIASLT